MIKIHDNDPAFTVPYNQIFLKSNEERNKYVQEMAHAK